MSRWPIALVCLVAGGLAGALIITAGLQGQAPPVPAIPRELTSYRDIVKRVLPAVVSIESKPRAAAKRAPQAQPQQRRFDNLPPGMQDQFRKFFEGMEEMPEGMAPSLRSFGSGFLVDPKGIVLTNFHVVSGTDRVEVTLTDGRKFMSSDFKGDRKNDLAIVRIKTDKDLPFLELGDSAAMEIGDRVLALGAPFGLAGSVTAGIVSGKERSNIERGDRAIYEDYIQTDAAINPGNSGGPLVNLEGKVIGINTAIKSESGGWQGVGLAITSNVAKRIVDQLERFGVVHRGYLGVAVEKLKPEVAADLGVTAGIGVVVSQVYDNTPAGEAGIKGGDVILRVGEKMVKDGRELQLYISNLPLHRPVDLTVVHDGQTKVVPVTIEEQPVNYGITGPDPRLARQPARGIEEVSAGKVGLKVGDLTPEMAEKFNFKEESKGAIITEVEPGSIAADAQLRRGYLIVKIDKKPVTSGEAARESLDKANLTTGVLLQVQIPAPTGTVTAYFKLKAEAGAEK